MDSYNETALDIHCVGGNVPSAILGKPTYDNYILPFEKRYIDIAQETGKPAIYHNCGQIMNLLESYKELGVSAVESFSPPPLGDGDLAKAIAVVDDQYTILGNIDQVNLLQKATVDEVKRVTEETIKIGKKSSRFIMQTADYIGYRTPMENIEAFVQTALQNADY